MKTDCDVIRDLMPLAAEGLASEKSRALVEEHLAECPECRARWETMRTEPVRISRDARPLEGLRDRIRRHELTIAAGLAGILLLILMVLWAAFYTSPDGEAGFFLLAAFVLIPLCGLLCGFAAGMRDGWVRWLLIPLFGALELLFPLLAFHSPASPFYFLVGALPVLLGTALGALIRWVGKRKEQKR